MPDVGAGWLGVAVGEIWMLGAVEIAGLIRQQVVSVVEVVESFVRRIEAVDPAINAVVTGTQAATIQSQLNFSRDMEREADRIGFQVMVAAGFTPGGMAS